MRSYSPAMVKPRRQSLRPTSFFGPSGETLEVLVEKDDVPSPPPPSAQTGSSSLDSPASSQNQSTYSWASSFSGETAELRRAAQYVPTETDLTSDGTITESEVVDSPYARNQRRKRIMAIAHTVRQLEGVGSRDMEDPTFYEVLAKAWYARFDKEPPPQGSRQSIESSIQEQLAVLGFAPGTRASEVELLDEMHSPPDPEFKTPHLGGEAEFNSSVHRSYPRPISATPSQRSRSIRYSYASTLHDLAMDGGHAQGDRLMTEKAWLQPSSYVGTPWGHDFSHGPPPLRPVTPEDVDSGSSNSHQYLDSPFSLEPVRNLRRIDKNIARPAARPPSRNSISPIELSQAGPSTGLGFTNAWWDAPQRLATSTNAPSTSSDTGSVDFHAGEDDTIPSRLLAPTSTPTRGPSPTFVVLDPGHSPTSTSAPIPSTNAPVSDTLFPPPLSPVSPPTPISHSASLHPSCLSVEMDQSDGNESPLSILSRPNFTKTPSNISSLPPSVYANDPGRNPQLEEDGSIGLAISSPPLTPSRESQAIQHPIRPLDQSPHSPLELYHQLPTPAEMTTTSPYRPASIDMAPPHLRDDSLSTMSLPSMTLPTRPMRARVPVPISASSSYRASWRDTASRPAVLEMDSEGDMGVQRPVAVLVEAPPRDASLRLVRETISQHALRQQQMPRSHLEVQHRSQLSVSPQTMFWAGFLLPFMWFIAGWVTCSRTAGDVEKGASSGVASTMPTARSTSRWTTWARHDDVWVTRSRVATAVSIPLFVIWGIVAIAVVGVLA